MKELSFEKMEEVNGGGWFTENHTWSQHGGCFLTGIIAGVSTGFNPLIGGGAALACYLLE